MHSIRMQKLGRLMLPAALALALGACSGSGVNDTVATGSGSGVPSGEVTNPTSTNPTPGSPRPTGTDAGDATLEISSDPNTNGGINYSTTTLQASPNTSVQLTYLNDTPLPHNVHIFKSEDPSGETLATTPLETGPDKRQEITFTTPGSGQYYFHCDAHPQDMKGMLMVR